MRMASVVAALALLFLTGACTADPGNRVASPSLGSPTPPTAESARPPQTAQSPSLPSSPAPTSGQSALLITVDDGSGSLTTWRLTCDPAGGDHPDPTAACEALDRYGERTLPPVEPGRACTQIYAGPQWATVSGMWRGKPVKSKFTLINGCEIKRWKALEGLLPPVDS